MSTHWLHTESLVKRERCGAIEATDRQADSGGRLRKRGKRKQIEL